MGGRGGQATARRQAARTPRRRQPACSWARLPQFRVQQQRGIRPDVARRQRRPVQQPSSWGLAMEGGGELTAYEQERQRRLEENRRKLEEMGLQQVGSESLTPSNASSKGAGGGRPAFGSSAAVRCSAATGADSCPRSPPHAAAVGRRRRRQPGAPVHLPSPPLQSPPADGDGYCAGQRRAAGGQEEAGEEGARGAAGADAPVGSGGWKGGKACMAGWGHCPCRRL